MKRRVNGEQTRFKAGNPGGPGRPKGLIGLVRAATGNGQLLVDIMRKIATNEDAKDADRIRAVEWLADRGFGKVAQPLTGEDDGGGVIVVQWGGRGGGDAGADA